MPIATNPQTGETLALGADGQWAPAQRAKNPQTGEELVFDGTEWQPLPGQTPAKPPPKERGFFNVVDDAVRSLASGATFGWADEAAAAANTATGLGVGKSYEENLASEQKTDAGISPWVSVPGEILGGIAGTIAAAPARVPAAIAALPRYVKYGATGAAAGGLSGAGHSEPGERLGGAGMGAAAGGATGIALPVVIELVGKFGKAAIRPVLDRIGKGPEKAAQRKVLEAMRRDEITPEQAMTRLKEMGDDAVLADVGPNISGLGEAVAQKPGESLKRATSLFESRREGQVGRVIQRLDEAIGPTGREVMESIEESDAFKNALKQSVPVDSGLLAVLRRPSMRSAWTKAQTLAAEQGQELPSLAEFVKRAEAGEITGVQTTVLHWLKKGLDDVLEPKRDPITGFVSSKFGQNQTRSMNETRTAFRTWAKEKNPEYGASLDRISADKRLDDAYTKGRDFFKLKSPGEVNRQMKRLDDRERRNYQRGIRDAIENRISDDGVRGYDTTRTVLGQTSKLRAAFGDKAEAMVNALRNERTMAQTENRVLGNSRTAFRQAAQEDSGFDPSFLTEAVQGNYGRATGGAFKAARAWLGRPSPRVADEIGPLLFSQGKDNAQILNDLLKGTEIKALKDAQIEEIIRVIVGGAGTQAGRVSGQERPR